MRAIRVHYANGNYIETNINGTTSEILQHYMSEPMNIGDGAGGDLIVQAVSVEFLDNDSGMIEIGDQVQSIETNWQGRVTGFEPPQGPDDCTMLICHHVSGGEIELDDKRWFDPRDVRLLRKAPMTKERAAEIVAECQRITYGPWSDQLRTVMTADEIAQVTAHWKTMSGSASFSDAILQIRNGK